MKTIILAGGRGTRLSEETGVKPKPMVQIGNRPILWHIMKIYSTYGIKEFVIGLGYKGEVIKEYFSNYQNSHSNWNVHLLDTGDDTQTGGRIKRGMQFAGRESVMATYGDGVGNVDIKKLIDFHKSHGKLATLTSVHPPSRFGEVKIKGAQVIEFKEKPQAGEGWINGGFFVLEPEVADYIAGDSMPFEGYPLETLCNEGQLMAYKHSGYWQPMDVMREKLWLQELWESGKAPWKVW